MSNKYWTVTFHENTDRALASRRVVSVSAETVDEAVDKAAEAIDFKKESAIGLEVERDWK